MFSDNGFKLAWPPGEGLDEIPVHDGPVQSKIVRSAAFVAAEEHTAEWNRQQKQLRDQFKSRRRRTK